MSGYTCVENDVIERADLSPTTRLTYIILLKFARQEGECFPGQERIAAELGVSARQVRRSLAELRDAGLISWQRQGRARANLYTLPGDGTDRSCQPLDRTSTTPQEVVDRTSMSAVDRTPMSAEEIPVDETTSARAHTREERDAASSAVDDVADALGITGAVSETEDLGKLLRSTPGVSHYPLAVSCSRKYGAQWRRFTSMQRVDKYARWLSTDWKDLQARMARSPGNGHLIVVPEPPPRQPNWQPSEDDINRERIRGQLIEMRIAEEKAGRSAARA